MEPAAIISAAALLTLAANSVYATWRANRDAEGIELAIHRAAAALERIRNVYESADAEHQRAKADAKRAGRYQ